MRFAIAFVLLAAGLSAQTTAKVVGLAPMACPDNWVGAGAAYGPPVTGWVSYGRLITNCLYSFTTHDVTISKAHQLQDSTRSGFGLVVRQVALGKLTASLIALGDVGVATGAATPPATGSVANVAYGGSAGIVAQWNGGHLTGEFFARRLQLTTGMQSIYEAGFGWAW